MMALSVNVPSEIFESSKDEIDLEDGEIEDDEEETVKTPAPPVERAAPAPPPKKPSPPKLEPPIIEASAVDSAKLLVAKNKDAGRTREPKTKESKKHSKKHSSKANKQGQKHPSEGAKGKQNAEVEDDWADNVEKAIRAAMGKDPGSSVAAVETRSASQREEPPHRSAPVATVLPPEFGIDPDGTGELSSEDKKARKKKKKKRHRDEDGEERKESKRRKKHHRKEEVEPGMEGEDDDEMLFVRGASPVNNVYRGDKRHTSGSPPSAYHDDPYLYADDAAVGQFDELYESYEDDSELEDYLLEIDGPRRGRGGIKRRGRGAMRGMLRKGIRPRDMLALKKRKRMLMQRHPDQRPDSVCMFFMQGKCQKGEDCPYSHDALPPRKMELCKFYLMDCCAKKDKCLYMHHDFPCKFHHTGLKCYAGDRCKFSHGQLNDILKNILLRHLETAPKEILGDFPRLSREGAAAMVHNKKTRDHSVTSSSAAAAAASTNTASASGKSIPSLFDIEVPVPLQFMPDKEGGGDSSPARKTTPMPSDNEDHDVNTEHSPTSKGDSRSPNKRHKNRWDDSEETNDKPSRHDQNKQHWDEQIRKQQEQHMGRGEEDGGEEIEDDGRWNVDAKQQRNEGGDTRWNNERKRRNNNNEADERWNDNRQREEGDSRWNDNRQRDDGENRWNENKEREEGDNRWGSENRQRDDGDSRWNENRQRDEDGDDRWNNESKQRDDGEKKKRRGEKEKKPRWEEGKEGHSRRRDNLRDDEKRKWESEERRSKKRGMKEKSGGYADSEGYGDELDHMKPMTRCYKDGKDEGTSQSQRLLRLAGYSSPHTANPGRRAAPESSTPRPLDLDTDDNDDDDLVMDVDEMDRGRKESVDESTLVIDTRDEEGGGARRRGEGEDRATPTSTTDNAGESPDAPVIPLHIQKLPKKQQELFLRIQQQQREQQNNQGSSAVDEADEDRQDESWYSSDEDEGGETSLSDVLRKLSASKVTDPDLAKKVTDLTKVPDVSDAVNKLLSSIGMRTTQPTQLAAETKTDKQKSTSTLPTLPLPPLPLPQPAAAGPRDPRLSRDPRNRLGSGETRTSQDSPTQGSSSSSSSRVDPRARRRSSTSRSIYDSISLSGPEKASDSPLSRGADTDLRGLLPNPRDVDLRPANRDLDLRVGYGDLDFRVGSDPRGAMSPLASSLLTTKTDPDVGVDIDLRRMLGGLPFKPVPQHTAATEIDGSLNSHPPIAYKVVVVTIPTPDYSRLKVSSTDQLVRVDPRLRKLFKITSSSPASPPPLATPSLVSPTPSGSGSSSNPPMIRVDPRRLASQSRSSVPDPQDQGQQPDGSYQQRGEPTNPGDPFLAAQNANLLNQQGQFGRNDLMSSPMLMQQMLPTMGLQNPHAMQNVDPRMFRNAPQTSGLLGDAPYYPSMPPHYDEMDRDNGNGSDNDQRSYYPGGKRIGSTMEMQEWEQQQMIEEQHHSYRNNSRGNWRGHPRRMTNSRYQYDKRNVNRSNRSYTPPQM